MAARRKRRRSLHPFAEAAQAAESARLRYVTDARAGLTRRRSGGGFLYFWLDGRRISDRPTLKRIRDLVIPPAWTSVWISPLSDGHLQATGRDARGRKQYRYHERWRQVRDETKYGRMLLFAAALPRIRARVREDLALEGLPRNKLLAALVRLLETTLIRVGNEEYARDNDSFGLTTLKTRHVRVQGDEIHFKFRGKSGKEHSVTLSDKRLARIVKRCQDLPGYDLFQYLDETGERRYCTSGDVNAYLQEIAGEEFTAKDFRTWAGSVLAAEQLDEEERDNGRVTLKVSATEAVKAVARALGNTPAVCRKAYIHPAVLEAYEDPRLRAMWLRAREGDAQAGLRKDESALLRYLTAYASRAAA